MFYQVLKLESEAAIIFIMKKWLSFYRGTDPIEIINGRKSLAMEDVIDGCEDGWYIPPGSIEVCLMLII